MAVFVSSSELLSSSLDDSDFFTIGFLTGVFSNATAFVMVFIFSSSSELESLLLSPDEDFLVSLDFVGRGLGVSSSELVSSSLEDLVMAAFGLTLDVLLSTGAAPTFSSSELLSSSEELDSFFPIF